MNQKEKIGLYSHLNQVWGLTLGMLRVGQDQLSISQKKKLNF